MIIHHAGRDNLIMTGCDLLTSLDPLTGKKLWGRRLAVAQTWLWIGGVFIFSRGQMQGGIAGMPWLARALLAPLALALLLLKKRQNSTWC